VSKTLGIIAGVLFIAGALFWNFSKSWNDIRLDDGKDGLIVFAASSIAYVLEDARSEIEDAVGTRLVIVAAASSTLARQIEQGAPADIFITADQVWLDYLKGAGHFEGGPLVLARNRLVWASPKTIATMVDGRMKVLVLSVDEFDPKFITGDPEYVPLGKYAKEHLINTEAWVEDWIIPAQNARTALALLETGIAQRGIIYRTDALSSDKVVVAREIPEETHTPILYWAVAVKQSELMATENLLNFLQSEPFKTILKARGFEVD